MEKTYQAVLGLDAKPANVVLCHQLGFIPFDPANTCYQAYLKWVSEGNAPLPADKPASENEQSPS